MTPITERTCKVCHETKPIDQYEKSPSKKNPWRNQCKKCRYDQKCNPRHEKKEPWTPEKQVASSRKSYLKHRDACSVRTKAFYAENKEWLGKWRKQYYLDNRDREIKQTRAYKDKKIKEDVAFMLEAKVRGRLYHVLKRLGLTKSKRTIELVGCTYVELKAHLESLFKPGMTWHKLGIGPGTFQIDHIVPVAMFDLADPEQQVKCFHWTNLQPLWDEDHKAKTREDMKMIRAKRHA